MSKPDDQFSILISELNDQEEELTVNSRDFNSESGSVYSASPGLLVTAFNRTMSDFAETQSMLFNSLPCIEHTESRIPPIELILQDDELKKYILTEESSAYVVQLCALLKISDSTQRLTALHDLATNLSKETTENLKFATIKTLISILSLFVRQRLAKCVDLTRAESGISISEIAQSPTFNRGTDTESNQGFVRYLRSCSMKGSQCDRVSSSQFALNEWAQISVCLRVIRNMCCNAEVQALVAIDELAPLFLSHLRHVENVLTIAKLENAEDLSVKEVKGNLLKNLMTFLSNSIANNAEAANSLLRFAWPDAYFVLLSLINIDSLEDLCLLLYMQLKPFFDGEYALSTDDSRSIQNLKKDFANMSLTWSQAHSVNSKNELHSHLVELHGSCIDILDEGLREAVEVEHLLIRQSTITGQKMIETTNEWFSYLNLKLMTMPKGRSIYLLLKQNVDNNTNRDNEDIVSRRIRYILYFLNEFAMTHDDEIAKIRELSQIRKSNRNRGDAKLSRKWNLVERSFINKEVLDMLVSLFRSQLESLTRNASGICFPQLVAALKNDASESDESFFEKTELLRCEIVLRPLMKCLVSFIAAPETTSWIAVVVCKQLFSYCIALLKDSVPHITAHCLANSETPDSFSSLCELFSPRDVLLLLCALIEVSSELKSLVSKRDAELVREFHRFQIVDIGCEQASYLADKILYAAIVPEAKAGDPARIIANRAALTKNSS